MLDGVPIIWKLANYSNCAVGEVSFGIDITHFGICSVFQALSVVDCGFVMPAGFWRPWRPKSNLFQTMYEHVYES